MPPFPLALRRPLACMSGSALPALSVALLLSLPQAAAGQAEEPYRISPRGTISQRLGTTLISVDYSRPLVRGRSDLFGKVIHWGELWTPGANEATVLEVSRDVRINGHDVKAGRWSMWVIPSQVGPWELVLDSRDSLFHTERPELTSEQVRFPLQTRTDAPMVETLAWTFPRVAHDGATLQLNWANVEIPLELEVESNRPPFTLTAEQASPYLGEWTVTFKPTPGDTASPPPPTVLTLSRSEDGILSAHFPPGAFGPPPPDSAAAAAAAAANSALSPQERERAEARRTLAALEQGEWDYILVPRAEGVFAMGWVENGELLEVYPFYHEFELEGGRAVRVTFRNEKDQVVGTAVRGGK